MSLERTQETLQGLMTPPEDSILRVDEGIPTVLVGGFHVTPFAVAPTQHVNALASLVCKTVTQTQELERFEKDGIVPGASWSNAVSSSRDSSGHVVCLLQKWSTSWGTYTEVRVAYMKDKDRLTVLFQLAQ